MVTDYEQKHFEYKRFLYLGNFFTAGLFPARLGRQTFIGWQ